MDPRTPVNWLRTFEVAARHLSLSAAASELSVTPAAVSQQVRLLEQRLGEPLFVRHARGLRLTLAGEALLPACRESFERLDTALKELFGRRRSEQLVVRVALGFARQWLLDRLAGFSRRHPDVAIRVVASVWDGNPLDANVDLDIRLAAGGVPGFESHALTDDYAFPVCSPALAARGLRPRTPAELLQRPLLATVGFAQGWKHWFAAADIRHAPPAHGLQFDSLRLALETAALGHGFALGRTSYAADLLRARRLKALFPDVVLKTSDDIYLTHHRGLDSRSPAALCRDWLLGRGTARPSPPNAHRAARARASGE
jgi:LysR family glycine cleavage system transcriptional activator